MNQRREERLFFIGWFIHVNEPTNKKVAFFYTLDHSREHWSREWLAHSRDQSRERSSYKTCSVILRPSIIH